MSRDLIFHVILRLACLKVTLNSFELVKVYFCGPISFYGNEVFKFFGSSHKLSSVFISRWCPEQIESLQTFNLAFIFCIYLNPHDLGDDEV